MTRPAPAQPDGESRPPAGFSPADRAAAADLAARTAGGVVAVIAALVTAAAELMLSPLRLGGTLIGVAVPVAIVANILLAWFAYTVVGRRWAVALPALAWFAVIVLAAGGTTEGDIGLAGNWVGIAIVILGPLGFAAAAMHLITVAGRR